MHIYSQGFFFLTRFNLLDRVNENLLQRCLFRGEKVKVFKQFMNFELSSRISAYRAYHARKKDLTVICILDNQCGDLV